MLTTQADLAHSGAALQEELRLVLFAAEPVASRLSGALNRLLHASVVTVADHRRCLDTLRHESFDVLLIEEVLATENATLLESLYNFSGEALVLEVNCALASCERIAREVRGALKRARAQREQARQAAQQSLRNALGAGLSGLLLASQIALQRAGPDLAPDLQNVVSLAEVLSGRLQA